jgi:hypothetical protein
MGVGAMDYGGAAAVPDMAVVMVDMAVVLSLTLSLARSFIDNFPKRCTPISNHNFTSHRLQQQQLHLRKSGLHVDASFVQAALLVVRAVAHKLPVNRMRAVNRPSPARGAPAARRARWSIII